MKLRALLAAAPAVFCLCAAVHAQQAQPAFNCAKADHEIEIMICGDAQLAGLDVRMAAVFRAAEKQPLSQDQLSALKGTQRGWIKGRNDCWKADDRKSCAIREYTSRIATLQARYGLVEAGKSFHWQCGGQELIVTLFKTVPPAVNIVRGNESITALQGPSASGVRYEGDFGVVFWEKGREATLVWPQGREVDCKPGQ